MTTGIPSIDLHAAYVAADAAMIASDYDLDLCQIADKAAAAYYGAMAEARAQWTAIPDSRAKFSGEENANDSEGVADNELHWLYVAIGSYQMNMDSGDYNADGSVR